jgi:hypothetical protein
MPKKLRDWTGYDYVGKIIQHESDGLPGEEMVELFQYLVDTGKAWVLQGSYGRTATQLIDSGLVARRSDQNPTRTIDEL